MKKTVSLIFLFLVIFLNNALAAVDYYSPSFLLESKQSIGENTYINHSAEDLFEISWDSPSQIEKVQIRAYLAQKHPNTATGLYSQYRMARYNGDDATANRLLDRVVQKYPNYLYGLYSMSFKGTAENQYDYLKKILSIDPSFLSYAAIRNAYFYYFQEVKDQVEADAFLSEWETKLGRDVYIFDFIRGINQQSDHKNYQQAASYYESALTKKGGMFDFEVWERLLDLKLGQLYDSSTMSEGDRLGHLNRLDDVDKKVEASNLSEAEKAKFLYRSAAYRGDKTGRTLYYAKAINKYFTAELAEKIRDTLWRGMKREEAINFLELAIKKYPKNQKLHELLARLYSVQQDLPQAENHSRKALEYSHTVEDRWNNTTYLCDDVLYPQSKAGEAYTLLNSFDKTQKNRGVYYTQLAKNRLLNGDYAQAQKNIEQVIAGINEKGGKVSDYALNLKKQIDTFVTRDQMLKNYNRKNAFEASWLAKNGESIKISVNFATNSDRIAQSDYARLAKIAKVISGQGAGDYRFTIEGHTDSVGSDEINNPLSQKRAEAVVRYLNRQHGIPPIRLEAKGFGSRNPVASNATESGRTKNRRVEVLLSANLKKPTITATTNIRGVLVAMSPDQKYFFANGYGGDYTLWDAENFIALKTFKDFLPVGDHINNKFRTHPEFSPNGRYIAYTNSFNALGGELVVFDSKTGRLVAQQGFFKDVLQFAWSPFSDEVAVRFDGGIVRYDVLTKRVVATGVITKHVADGGFVWIAGGKYLAMSEKYEDGKVRIFDAKSMTQVSTLREAYWPHALGASADGRYLFCTAEGGQLHVWDSQYNWAHKSMRIPVKPSKIVAHPSKYEILLNDWGGGESNQLAVIDIDSMTVKGKMTVGGSDYKYQYLDDGNKILFVNHREHEFQVLNGKSLKVETIYRGETAMSRGGFADPSSGRLLTWDQEGFHVWDVATGKKIHTWPGNYKAAKPEPGKSGTLIALLADEKNNRTRVFRIDLASLTRKEILTLDILVNRWGLQGGDILFAGTPFMPAETGSPAGFVRLYELGSGKLKGEAQVEMATEPLRYARMGYSRFDDLEISPDNSTVGLKTAWGDGWRQDKKVSKVTRVYSLKSGKQIRRIDKVGGLYFKDNGSIVIGDQIYSVHNGAYIAEKGVQQFPYIVGQHGYLDEEVQLSEKNLKISIKNDNRIEFFDLKNEELALTILSKRNNEWIAYATTGEFTASLNGTKKVFWLMGENRLPFDALKEKYENPNLIQQKLAKVISGEAPVINVDPDIDPDIFTSPYKVSLVSASNIETSNESYLLKLDVTKEESGLPDPQFDFFLNGREVKKGRGFEVVPVKKGPASVTVERKFDLQDGLNVIQANLVYKGAKVQSQIVHVTRNKVGNVVGNTQLWFFGVGVSEYEKPEQNLEYAHKDAEALATLLKKQEGKLFQKVNTLTLTNADATEKNVRINMQRFLKQASTQDVVIIFMAGHGVQDNEQNLYFMTHDSVLKEAYTGMELSKFESYLKARPLNQKVVLLMDICHAGSIGMNGNRRGMITAEDAVKQLAEGTGTVVFASSTGKESSLEDAAFGGGHGAFTSALLEGLKGQADAEAGDKNKYVGILELMSYVSRRVPELTDGDQHPTTPQSMNVRDFPLATY